MGKKSFWERIFGTSHSPKGLTRRGLKVENLEERQLLSAVGWETTPVYSEGTDLKLDSVTVKMTLDLEETDTVPDQILIKLFLNESVFKERESGDFATTTDASDLDSDESTSAYYEFTVSNDGTLNNWVAGVSNEIVVENNIYLEDVGKMGTCNLSVDGFTMIAQDDLSALTSPTHLCVMVEDAIDYTNIISASPSGTQNLELEQLAKPVLMSATGSADTDNYIQIEWESNNDASGYEYQYKASGTDWGDDIISEDNTYINPTGLTAGEVYDFRFRAVGSGYAASEWTEATYTIRTLDAPVITVNSRTADDIIISWGKDENALYSVYVQQDDESFVYGYCNNAKMTDGLFSLKNNLLNADDSAFIFQPGTDYRIQVNAIAVNPSEYLGLSTSKTASTKTALTVPVNFASSAHTDMKVTLSWDAVTNAESYTVTADDGNSATDDLTQNFTTLGGDFTGLSANTAYTFKVKAVANPESEYTDSEYSDGISVTTMAKLAPAPELTVDSATRDSITVSWTAPSNAQTDQTYTVQYAFKPAEGADPTWNSYAVDVTTLGITVDGLSANTTYQLRVKANTTGEYYESDWSNVGEKLTPLTALVNPSGTSATWKVTASGAVTPVGGGANVADQIILWRSAENNVEQATSIITETIALNATDYSLLNSLDASQVDALAGRSFYFWVQHRTVNTDNGITINESAKVQIIDSATENKFTYELADFDTTNWDTTLTEAKATTATVSWTARTINPDFDPAATVTHTVTAWYMDGETKTYVDEGDIVVAANGASATISNLTPNTQYYWTVTASVLGYNDATSDPKDFLTDEAVAAPTIYWHGFEEITVEDNTVLTAKFYWDYTEYGTKAASYTVKAYDVNPLSLGSLPVATWANLDDSFRSTNRFSVAENTPTEGEITLNPTTRYWFTVTAVAADGYGDDATSDATKTLAAPVVSIDTTKTTVDTLVYTWTLDSSATTSTAEYYNGTDWVSATNMTNIGYDYTLTLDGLAANSEYSVRVKASDYYSEHVESWWYVTAPAYTLAAAPTLTISDDLVDGAMVLNWTMPEGESATSFLVYVGDAADGVIVEGTTGGTYNFTGFNAGVEYSFKVAAVNADGAETLSGAVTGYRFDTPTISSIVAGSDTTDGYTLQVNWNSVSTTDPAYTVVNYTLEYTTDPAAESPVWIKVADTIADSEAPQYTVKGLASNTQYTFRVTADKIVDVASSKATFASIASDEVSAYTLAAAPTVSTPTLDQEGDLVLAWTMPEGNTAANFKAEYKTVESDWTQIGELVGGDVFLTTFADFAPGTLYEFRVSALNSATPAVGTLSTNTVKAAQFVTPVIDGEITAAIDEDGFTLTPEWSDSTIGTEIAPNYSLQWKLANEDTTVWTNATTTDTEYTVADADLRANSSYNFKVTAGLPDAIANDITLFASSESVVVNGLTLAVAPTILATTETNGSSATDDSATIVWVMPLGADLTGVTYSVYRVDGAGSETVLATGLTSYTYVAEGLNEGTNYTFMVSADNASGSNYSDNEDITTKFSDPAGTVAPTEGMPWSLTFSITTDLPTTEADWQILRTNDQTADPNVSSDDFELVESSQISPFSWAETAADNIREGGYYYWVQTFENRDSDVVSSNYVSMNSEAITVTPKDLPEAVIAIEDQDVDMVLFSFDPVSLTDTTTEVGGYVVTLSGPLGSEITPVTYTFAAGDEEYWNETDGCYNVDFDNLLAGTTYTFEVDAYAQFNSGAPVDDDLAYNSSNATISIYTDLADPEVTQVLETEKARSFTFSWTQTPDTSTEGYKVEVFKGTDASGSIFWSEEYVLTEKPESITITESNGTLSEKVTPETDYFVKVTAFAAEDAEYADGIGFLTITTEALTPLSTPELLLGSPTAAVNSFTAAWSASTPATEIANYIVTYWTDTASLLTLNTTETMSTISGLLEETTYTFTIQAIAKADSEYGDSLISAEYTVTTLKSIPIPDDEEVVTEEPTTNSIVVEWEPVAEEDQNLVAGYTIEVLNPAGEVVQTIPVSGADTGQVQVNDLASGTEYVFNVYANPSEQGVDEGYGDTLVDTDTGKTAYADPVWNLSEYNYAAYVLSTTEVDDEAVVTLTGYAKNSEVGDDLGSFSVLPSNTPVILGAQNAKENILITESARNYFENINVLGGGANNFYVRRDTLVLYGSENDDIVDLSHVAGTETILDDRDILGSGAIQVSSKDDSGEFVPSAIITFAGMDQVIADTLTGSDTLNINEMTASYTWATTRPSEEEIDFDEDTLDFSNAVIINDRANVSGAIVNLNASYQRVSGQVGRLAIAAGEFGVEKIIGSKAIDTIISGKKGIEFVDESGSRNTINLTRSESDCVVNVTGDNQTIFGGQGNDIITVVGDSCVVNMSRDGANVIDITGDSNTVIGGSSEDWVQVRGSRNVINTMNGDDTVLIYDRDDAQSEGNIVHLGDGDDMLLASVATGTERKNFFYGEDGADVIIGSEGHDYIYGGGGNNFLIGMAGKDYIFGGNENDLLAGCHFRELDYYLYGDSDYNVLGIEDFVGQFLAKVAEEDFSGILDLTGVATSDNEKDFMYRGGGNNHLFFQSLAETDLDYANLLNVGNFKDWVIDEKRDFS